MKQRTQKRRGTPKETRELAEILVSAVDSPRRFNSFDVHEFAASAVLSQSLSFSVARRVAACSPAASFPSTVSCVHFLTFLCHYSVLYISPARELSLLAFASLFSDAKARVCLTYTEARRL